MTFERGMFFTTLKERPFFPPNYQLKSLVQIGLGRSGRINLYKGFGILPLGSLSLLGINYVLLTKLLKMMIYISQD